MKLDLGPFMSELPPEEVPYDLYAVVEHIGESLDSGHCIAYVRGSDGRWYRCDDAVVTEVRQPSCCCLHACHVAQPACLGALSSSTLALLAQKWLDDWLASWLAKWLAVNHSRESQAQALVSLRRCRRRLCGLRRRTS